MISVVSGIENASEEFNLCPVGLGIISLWRIAHSLCSTLLFAMIIKISMAALICKPQSTTVFHTQHEGHRHQLHEIKKIVGRKVTGYLKLGALDLKIKFPWKRDKPVIAITVGVACH